MAGKPMRPIQTHMLRKDHIPSDTELSQTLGLMEERRDLELYQGEIVRLQQMMDSLEAGKSALKANIERRRSSISALRRTLAELWEIIFDLACSSRHYSLNIDKTTEQRPAIETAPATISHVCSRWRGIITGMPGVWSSLRINFDKLSQDGLATLGMFLENSRKHHLTLCIERFCQNHPLTIFDELAWKMLAKHLPRIQHLDISYVDELDMLENPLDAQEISFPNLETYSGGPNFFDASHPWWQALHAAPALKTARTSILHPLSIIPYSRVTTLELTDVAPAELADLGHVLAHCRELEFLSIESIAEGFVGPGGFDSVEMRSLRTLIIHESQKYDLYDHTLRQFFHSLTMPSLETFDLRCSDCSRDVAWPIHLLVILGRSSVSLRNLSICLAREEIDRYNKSLPILLGTVPHLTFFQFGMAWYDPTLRSGGRRKPGDDFDFNDSLVTQLFTKLGEPNGRLTPNLTTIVISLSDISLNAGLLDGVLEAAMSRSPTCLASQGFTSVVRHPLAKIRLTRIPCHTLRWPIGGHSCLVDLEDSILDKVVALERDGLKVSFEESL
ncbi:hypothetical protein V5O48_003464 [Marasmius crinis-equi]|uniref:F-box domain-containing protein n=1 Tax=Marasmius crinis-equi TaxID=585013 RepID=A0ABR3FSS3_9AGAR